MRFGHQRLIQHIIKRGPLKPNIILLNVQYMYKTSTFWCCCWTDKIKLAIKSNMVSDHVHSTLHASQHNICMTSKLSRLFDKEANGFHRISPCWQDIKEKHLPLKLGMWTVETLLIYKQCFYLFLLAKSTRTWDFIQCKLNTGLLFHLYALQNIFKNEQNCFLDKRLWKVSERNCLLSQNTVAILQLPKTLSPCAQCHSLTHARKSHCNLGDKRQRVAFFLSLKQDKHFQLLSSSIMRFDLCFTQGTSQASRISQCDTPGGKALGTSGSPGYMYPLSA